MSRLASPFLILLLLAGCLLLLVVSAVPGLRHRHEGGVTHSHGGGVEHSHDGVTHRHDHSHRDGWHVHITLFGYELTLWESATVVAESEESEPPAPAEDDRETVHAGQPVLLASSPMTAGWFTLFWIDAAPTPARVRWVPDDAFAVLIRESDGRFESRCDVPPVPPPEAV